MSIQIIHCSDVHLDKNFGISNLEKARQRKDDLNNAFSAVVDHAVETKPDIFLISGDVFDKLSPTNAAVNFLLQQIKKLNDVHVETFLIGGNHDVPKLGPSSSLAIGALSSAGLATVFDSSDAVQKRVLRCDNRSVCISGRSYYTKQENANPLAGVKIPLDGDYNIFMIHGSLQGLEVLPSDNIQGGLNPFSADDLAPGLNYLALGHFHNYFIRDHNACTIANPGSLERLSFSEINDRKGFLWVEMHNSEATVERVEIPGRPMATQELSLSKEAEYSPTINDSIIEFLDHFSDPSKLFKLRLQGQISQNQYNELKMNVIISRCKEMFFYLHLDRDALEVEGYGRVFFDHAVDKPTDAFTKRLDLLLEKTTDETERRKLTRVKEIGLKYLEEVR